MLNNGGMSNGGRNGMTTPDGSNSGGMYGGGGPSPSEYSPGPNSNPGSNSFHHQHQQLHPHNQHNGGHMMGHSGGICSQNGHNQNPNCPPGTKACAGCHGPILERYLLHALERYWHNSCLKCQVCMVTLADLGGSCFTRDGMVLCKHDYTKLFGMRGTCQGCGQGIPGDELVMRASVSPPGSSPPLVFHMKCFMCSKCNIHLSTGDRYSVLNGALFCEQDALKIGKPKIIKNGIAPSNSNVPITTNGTNGTTTPATTKKAKVGRPRRSRD